MYHRLAFLLVFQEVRKEFLHDGSSLFILYHALFSIHNGYSITEREVNLAPDHSPVFNGIVYCKFDSFGSGVNFILADCKGEIQAQASVSGLHVDIWLPHVYPACSMSVKDILHLVKV